MVGYILRSIVFLFLSAVFVTILLLLSWAGIVPIEPKVLSGTLGFIMILILALPVILWYLVKFKIKRFSNELFSNFPILQPMPMTIHLKPAKKLGWRDLAQLDEWTNDLKGAGYSLVGDFAIEELPQVFVRGFMHSSDHSIAGLYEAPGVGIIADLVQHFANGDSLTVTNAPNGEQLDQNPRHEKRYAAGASVPDLQSLLISGRQGKAVQATDLKKFAEYFERAWQETMSWKSDRGGHSMDEIRRIAISMNGNFSEDDIKDAHLEVNRQFRRNEADE